MSKVVTFLAGLALVVFLIYTWAMTPIVYESFATGQCVEVYDPSEQYSCDNLPTRYTHEWRQ